VGKKECVFQNTQTAFRERNMLELAVAPGELLHIGGKWLHPLAGKTGTAT